MPETSLIIYGLVTARCSDRSDDPLRGADNVGGADATASLDFESVLRLFHKRVYNLAYRLLGNADEAADLVQEVFVNAYKAYPRFRGSVEGIYPWLCQITVNGCKNKFREMSRRRRYEVVSLDGRFESQDSGWEVEIGDDLNDPAGLLQRRELADRIQEAIQSLHPDYRVVVVLRDLHGLSYKEIADVTGLTLETVKTRLFRARSGLRRRLTPYIED